MQEILAKSVVMSTALHYIYGFTAHQVFIHLNNAIYRDTLGDPMGHEWRGGNLENK